MFPLCHLQIGDFKAAHRLLLAVATVARAAPYPLPSRGQAANDSLTAENQQSIMLGTASYCSLSLYNLCHLFLAPCSEHCSTWFHSEQSSCTQPGFGILSLSAAHSPALATHRGQVITRQLQSAMHVFFCCYYSQLTDAKVTFGQSKCGNPPLFKPAMSNLDHHISICKLICKSGLCVKVFIPLLPASHSRFYSKSSLFCMSFQGECLWLLLFAG